MTTPPVKEGEVDFHVPGLSIPCKTWYKIVGDLNCPSSKRPLILLHGGPGACHEYLLPFVDLVTQHSIPCIFYDQLGNGRSTHLRDKNGDEEFCTPSLFRRELDNLVDHLGLRDGPGFDILGQSWGGMLGSSYAVERPKGLRRLVIANSPASSLGWRDGVEQLLKRLPQDVVCAIREGEASKNFESKEFQEAIEVVYKKHLCRVEPWPAPEVNVALEHLTNDPTVYSTMNGPSEITIIGSLKTWSIIDQLHKIEVPVFVYNGTEDEAQDIAVEPFFWHIPKVRWVTIEDSSHFSHVEKRERVMHLVGDFLSAT